MKTIWDPACRVELLARVARLQADRRPRWGSLTPVRMLAHVTDALRAALGEVTVHSRPGPLRNPLIRHLVIYWLPWPKGVPTAPEFLRDDPRDLEQNQADLRATVQRFVQRSESGSFEPHPAFGALSRRDWGRLTYRHLDHHLRQFGL